METPNKLMEGPNTPTTESVRIRRWRSWDLAEHVGTPRATAIRTLIPDMVAAGVLARRGRYWYGRAIDIDSWLLGRWSASPPSGAP
jgi:hypothetical protein